MPEAELKYELLAHYKDGRPVATVWWDGKSIQSDNPNILDQLKRKSKNGYSFEDGEDFIKQLPNMYKNGYIIAKRVK